MTGRKDLIDCLESTIHDAKWANKDYTSCDVVFLNEILMLLKAQEARVLTAAEIEQWDNDVWIENFNENRIYVIDKSIAGFAIACMRGRYRCWTSRPTEEQMREEAWPGA